MNPVNNAALIRRELMMRLARLTFRGELEEKIDRIPLEMFPRSRASIRCCIHKDRAVIRYRLMALLGFGIEAEEDELMTLAEYARTALARQRAEPEVLTVLDEACSACVQSRYFVTNACRGCMARPCTLNCPKDAIRMVQGRAEIDTEKCVNCGICVKVCPYHAVVRMPIPCEEACPVDAITKDEYGKERIDHDKCIQCGKCQQACPFGAVMEKSSLVQVAALLSRKEPLAALVAPAVAGQFDPDPRKVYGALKALGFSVVAEAAAGADRTVHREAEEWQEHAAAGGTLLASSCCPAWTRAAERHLAPGIVRLSTTPSPMRETAALVREAWPEHRTVFIGPCTAKRQEALADPAIDLVLTFEELGALFVAADVDVKESPAATADIAGSAAGRGFPVSGGVAKAMARSLDDTFHPAMVNGLDRKALTLLKVYGTGKCPGNFLEVMACAGGCIAGPGAVAPESLALKSLAAYTTPETAPRRTEPVPG